MAPSRTITKIKGSAVESAEQWVIQCGKCDHTAAAMERGIFRAWASSSKKRVLARCTKCGKLTFAKLTKDPERACKLRIRELDEQLEVLD